MRRVADQQLVAREIAFELLFHFAQSLCHDVNRLRMPEGFRVGIRIHQSHFHRLSRGKISPDSQINTVTELLPNSGCLEHRSIEIETQSQHNSRREWHVNGSVCEIPNFETVPGRYSV